MSGGAFSFRNPEHHLEESDVLGIDDLDDFDGDGDGNDGGADLQEEEYINLVRKSQAKVVDHLKQVGDDRSRCTYAKLSDELSVDFTHSLMTRLLSNPRVTPFGDPLTMDRQTGHPDLTVEGGLIYSSKFAARDKLGILRLVNSCSSGVLGSDIADCYKGAARHLQELLDEGKVGGVPKKAEAGAVQSEYPSFNGVIFPRNGAYFTEIGEGVAEWSDIEGVDVTLDERKGKVAGGIDEFVRRGEGLKLVFKDDAKNRGPWKVASCRVSSEVKEGIGRFEQTAKAQAPLTLSMMSGLSKRNDVSYVRPLEGNVLPCSTDFMEEGRCTVLRHGCDSKIKKMWLETRAAVPEEDGALLEKMVKAQIALPGEKRLSRDLALGAGTGAAKKKRKSYVEKKFRVTSNTHLEGTEVGEFLKGYMKQAHEKSQM